MAANQLLVPVDPTPDKRTRNFEQVVALILNALIRAGTLTQTGPKTWGIPGLLFTGYGPPAATLGSKGDYYLDLNPPTAVLYQFE